MNNNANGTLYEGLSRRPEELAILTTEEALHAFMKGASELAPVASRKSLHMNEEQVFLLTNLWIKYVGDLGFGTFAEYIRARILEDGLISTIAECSNTADAIIANGDIPNYLNGYFSSKGAKAKTIKYALQALRFPKRFSPVNASLLNKRALDAFVENDAKSVAPHSADVDVEEFRPKHLYSVHLSDNISFIPAKEGDKGAFLSKHDNKWYTKRVHWRAGDPIDCTGDGVMHIRTDIGGEIHVIERFADGSSRVSSNSMLGKMFTEAAKELFSFDGFDRKSGRRFTPTRYSFSDVFAWTDEELEHAAISSALPSGAALNCCKNPLCKALNAQMMTGRPYGEERCVPPYVIAPFSNNIYSQSTNGVVVAPTFDDLVVVKCVPKTYKTPRIIAPETVNNSIVAWMIERELRRAFELSRFKDCLIIKLDDTPTNGKRFANVQHERAAHGLDWATIDQTAASDNVFKAECASLCPPDYWRIIEKGIAKHYSIGKSVVRSLKMVSTMGNPLTFRNMEYFIGTISLLSIWLDMAFYPEKSDEFEETDWAVYGDDSTIAAFHAETFMSLCEVFGLKVNKEKSHWMASDPYREACGREYWNGTDITSMYWPRRNLVPSEVEEKVDSYDQEDKSFWSSIIALNNHLVELCESKFNEDRVMPASTVFMQSYIHTNFPDLPFTHPRAPWRKPGILLGYQPRVQIVRLDNTDRPIDDTIAREKYLSYSCEESLPYLEAVALYDDPTVRFIACEVGEVGRVRKDPPSFTFKGEKKSTCACASLNKLTLDLYKQSVLFYQYLADGPSVLGVSEYEAGLTTARKLDAETPLVGLTRTVI